MDTQKIPATIITGFLGAGKTTLIRNLLMTAGGRRIALIINEFGDLGVDGEVLKGCGDATCTEDDIVELTNGCICCTVADDFIPTITKLLERENKPDHIVIETSGLALPQPLVSAFNWPDIRERVTVDGVVSVVDGRAVHDGQFASDLEKIQQQRTADDALDHESPLEELFEDQLNCADMIVLNKSDLLENAELETLEAEIKSRVKRSVKLVRAANGSLPADVILGMSAASELDIENRKSHHDAHHHDEDDHDDHHHHHDHDHDHDDFENFVVGIEAISDAKTFVSKLKPIIEGHEILRLKGFIEVANKPMRLVIQAVGKRIDFHFDRTWEPDEKRSSRLVVIGLAGLDEAKISEAIGVAAKG